MIQYSLRASWPHFSLFHCIWVKLLAKWDWYIQEGMFFIVQCPSNFARVSNNICPYENSSFISVIVSIWTCSIEPELATRNRESKRFFMSANWIHFTIHWIRPSSLFEVYSCHHPWNLSKIKGAVIEYTAIIPSGF